MSYYFREKPRFGDKFRGKSGDELLEELKQQFADEGRPWDSHHQQQQQTPPSRLGRDTFERHTSFPRAKRITKPSERKSHSGRQMDSSPVIIDNATKFGRDLDPRFPGFPFDDEGGFGRRSDIRSHLDDLAARHPEFADHLLGSAWGDVPFSTGSLRRGNRRPSQERPSANSVFHNHPDEDARSQASGGSAASGASGVSSHGSEPEQQQQPAATAATETDPSSASARKIPQYNLRNTVDIGQHQHNMEAPQQQQRNVRSMSAPPENRQNEQPRFVSRVDINPDAQQQQPPQQQQAPQPQEQQRENNKSPPPSQEHKSARQQSNVRQIPIFVEGRDKPVIAREFFDEPDFPRQSPPQFPKRQSPPQFPKRQSPPQFSRPAPHYQSFNRQPTGWTSHFAEPFFEPPQSHRWTNSPPSHPQFRHPQQQQQQEKPRYTYQTDTQPRPKPQAQPQQPQQQQQQKPQHPQSEAQQEPPKPRQQVQPKDPLEKVAAVQQEVDALAEQVKEYAGNSRKDKQYMYLDEMLTRELIKLDDIDTEGKDNVRTARKQAIKAIQDTIGLLESKAPLPGQQPPAQTEQRQDAEPAAKQEEQTAAAPSAEKREEAVKPEAMDTQEAPVQEEQKAIPLPPPSSPAKDSSAAEAQPPSETAAANPAAPSQAQQAEQVAQEAKPEPMDATPVPQAQQQQPPPPQEQQQPMEVRQSSPAKELQLGKEDQKDSQALIAAEQKQEVKEAAAPEQPAVTEKPKKEPPPVPAKPSRSPKKAKKAAAAAKQKPEQQPVCETAIPLPAPGQSI